MRGKNITYNEIFVWNVTTWGTTLAARVSGYGLVKMSYCGWTKREMYKRFYDYCNSL